MIHADSDDVVVRPERGNTSTVYLLGTPSAPDQFVVRTHDEAVAQALRFAEHQHVAAWFVESDVDVVLLGTFRKENSGTRNEGDAEATTQGVPRIAGPATLR